MSGAQNWFKITNNQIHWSAFVLISLCLCGKRHPPRKSYRKNPQQNINNKMFDTFLYAGWHNTWHETLVLRFGPNEDFSAYPRTADADEKLAFAAGSAQILHRPTLKNTWTQTNLWDCPGPGWVANICSCVFFGFLLGKKETHKQNPPKNSRAKNQPNEEVFGTDIPRTSRGHSRGYPGPKLWSGRSKSWKIKHFGADIHDLKARTSTTLGNSQELRSQKLWAEFSSP